MTTKDEALEQALDALKLGERIAKGRAAFRASRLSAGLERTLKRRTV